MSDTPSARPRALSFGADARSQGPICPPLHTASPQHMSIISHPQPLAHEIVHHYEIDMEHRLAIHLQHDHSPDNSLTSPPIPPIPHIPSISPTPLPHSSRFQQRSTHTPPSSQPTRLKASELPKFHGRDDDDIVDWVQKISSIKRGSGATRDGGVEEYAAWTGVWEAGNNRCSTTDSDILPLLPSVLRGNAFNYYSRLSEQEHATLNTWASWAKELQHRFLPPNRLHDLKDKCIHGFLGHNEKFSNYFEDKIYLQQFLFPTNTEDSLLIRDILGGISATLRAQLQTGVTPNMTLRDFCRHMLQIEPDFHPHLFPSSHRHPADRVRNQRNHHSHTSFTTSATTRTSRFTPQNRPEKPSTPCFTCGAYHWSDQCTLKQQQRQQQNASRPSSTANNSATSTSSDSRSSFPSWARPSPNTNSSDYKPPANSVNSIDCGIATCIVLIYCWIEQRSRVESKEATPEDILKKAHLRQAVLGLFSACPQVETLAMAFNTLVSPFVGIDGGQSVDQNLYHMH
ncbi:hypothetical protein I313_03852 [Cryptococcus deuterogattii Ram5]|uniref:Retrotransposon gag domain-containing protein n=1 Tax=Cryptococcus deuterogattii Ram5 TaxID=1296110 RepID=A0A0D0TVJ2_9TREE|nr:hypothetical protein I313_03852 [Cryptococcus deuterogattii Ram5]